MKATRFREVRLVLPMETEMEIAASETASAMATSVDMHPDKVDELKMAVLEACINAFEHSRAPDKKLYMTLSLVGNESPERIEVTIRDTGIGFSPEDVRGRMEATAEGTPRKRGWGLQIIRGLMDEVKIDSTPEGTTVIMTKHL